MADEMDDDIIITNNSRLQAVTALNYAILIMVTASGTDRGMLSRWLVYLFLIRL